MKRNAFLITAALFCLATSALAGEEIKHAQPQPQPTEQTQTAQPGAEAPKDQDSSAKCDCPVKPKKHAKQKQQHTERQVDPDLLQNQKLYGGG